MKFAFIEAENASTMPAGNVSELCRALRVSRAGFYAWCCRPESARAKDDALLGVKVGEAFEHGRGQYGSPRVHRELTKQGFAVSRKRVIRLMQCSGPRFSDHPFLWKTGQLRDGGSCTWGRRT